MRFSLSRLPATTAEQTTTPPSPDLLRNQSRHAAAVYTRSDQPLAFHQEEQNVFFFKFPFTSWSCPWLYNLCCGIYQHCLYLAVTRHWHHVHIFFLFGCFDLTDMKELQKDQWGQDFSQYLNICSQNVVATFRVCVHTVKVIGKVLHKTVM